MIRSNLPVAELVSLRERVKHLSNPGEKNMAASMHLRDMLGQILPFLLLCLRPGERRSMQTCHFYQRCGPCPASSCLQLRQGHPRRVWRRRGGRKEEWGANEIIIKKKHMRKWEQVGVTTCGIGKHSPAWDTSGHLPDHRRFPLEERWREGGVCPTCEIPVIALEHTVSSGTTRHLVTTVRMTVLRTHLDSSLRQHPLIPIHTAFIPAARQTAVVAPSFMTVPSGTGIAQ